VNLTNAAPGSPEAILNRLLGALDTRQQSVAKLERYYSGDHPLPTMPTSAQAMQAETAYRRLLQMGRTNWCRLVADAPGERLQVIGFRSGIDQSVDADVWDIWQTNQLDADSALVHSTALVTGQAFALVWADANGEPTITPEHPSQCIVAYERGTRRKRSAGLKAWIDDSGKICATLYLPDFVLKYQTSHESQSLHGNDWVRREIPGETWPAQNPLGVVPLVEFRANPTLTPAPIGGGVGEFEPILDIQDRVNRTLFTRLLAGEFGAFRQRWVVGMDLEADPVTGRVQEPFKAAIDRLWMVDDPNVKFGEFSATDLRPFIDAVEADVTHLAAITKTPPHYLLGKAINISAEALKAAEAGLVAKTARHRDQFTEAWEEVLRLAIAVRDPQDPRAQDLASMVVWHDIEQRTWGETVDAVLKMQALGVPQEALWSMLPGVTPQDVARWRTMSASAAFTAALSA
jgi:hypothetical protein